MKRGLVRLLLCAGCVLLCTSCVIYTFSSQTGPWDFENSTSLPDGFTSDAPYAWTIDTTEANAGTSSVKSGSPLQYSGSTLELTVDTLTDTADIHFSYKNGGMYSDCLNFYINGFLAGTYFGSDYGYSYWETVDIYDSSYIDASGSNTLKWEYCRSSSTPSSDNCAWVDDVVIDGM
jgi:hypothetical protein